jgi:hypothetical protein
MKYGLNEEVIIDKTGKIFDEYAMWHKPHQEPTEIWKSTVATLVDLFSYIHYAKKNNSVTFPNGIKCNDISELFDFISISYLATHHLLTENNIYPCDMHAGNVFIHWLDDNSYYDGKCIKNVEEIIYKVNNKYYKTKTFGFVMILGDTGTFMINAKKDVKIIGQIWDINKNYKLIDRRMQPEYSNADFMFRNYNFLTPSEFGKTVAYEILNSEPYCSYPLFDYGLLGKDLSYLDKLKSTYELFDFFGKYRIDKYVKKQNNILISA